MDSHDSTTFLRRSLQLDGVASGLTGVLLLVAAGPVSTLIGNAAPGIARLVGALSSSTRRRSSGTPGASRWRAVRSSWPCCSTSAG
jgi:hypothetical protein